MVPKPKNMAAAHSSVALPKSFVVWKPPLDEQCDSYLAMRLRYLWALLWEESVEPWKLLFDIQGDGNNTTVNLQSAGRQHTLWQLKLNYFDYHRPRWVKILFYGRGCMTADVIKWKTRKLNFFFFRLFNLPPAAQQNYIRRDSIFSTQNLSDSTHELLVWSRFVTYIKAWTFSNATLCRKISRVTAVAATWYLNSCLEY